jgi:hypothetical protein
VRGWSSQGAAAALAKAELEAYTPFINKSGAPHGLYLFIYLYLFN